MRCCEKYVGVILSGGQQFLGIEISLHIVVCPDSAFRQPNLRSHDRGKFIGSMRAGIFLHTLKAIKERNSIRHAQNIFGLQFRQALLQGGFLIRQRLQFRYIRRMVKIHHLTRFPAIRRDLPNFQWFRSGIFFEFPSVAGNILHGVPAGVMQVTIMRIHSSETQVICHAEPIFFLSVTIGTRGKSICFPQTPIFSQGREKFFCNLTPIFKNLISCQSITFLALSSFLRQSVNYGNRLPL